MARPPWERRIEQGYDSYLDTDWASVAELQPDGSARVVVLTIDRLPAMAFDYFTTGRTMSWSIPRDRRFQP